MAWAADKGCALAAARRAAAAERARLKAEAEARAEAKRLAAEMAALAAKMLAEAVQACMNDMIARIEKQAADAADVAAAVESLILRLEQDAREEAARIEQERRRAAAAQAAWEAAEAAKPPLERLWGHAFRQGQDIFRRGTAVVSQLAAAEASAADEQNVAHVEPPAARPPAPARKSAFGMAISRP